MSFEENVKSIYAFLSSNLFVVALIFFIVYFIMLVLLIVFNPTYFESWLDFLDEPLSGLALGSFTLSVFFFGMWLERYRSGRSKQT
jgi:hypothetical protein